MPAHDVLPMAWKARALKALSPADAAAALTVARDPLAPLGRCQETAQRTQRSHHQTRQGCHHSSLPQSTVAVCLACLELAAVDSHSSHAVEEVSCRGVHQAGIQRQDLPQRAHVEQAVAAPSSREISSRYCRTHV